MKFKRLWNLAGILVQKCGNLLWCGSKPILIGWPGGLLRNELGTNSERAVELVQITVQSQLGDAKG